MYHVGPRVLRGLDAQAAADWKRLSRAPFLVANMAAGRIVDTDAVPLSETAELALAWEAVLEHDRIPFVSYPYEWTFSMLQDAAVLHLELLLEALTDGFTMADGTAYNVQWRGSRPVFVDVLSFRPLAGGGPWAGYRQFCQTFLFPLLIQARQGVPAHLLLRTRLDGVEPGTARRLLGALGSVRRGAFRHVLLHALADRRLGGASSTRVSADLRDAGFGAELTAALARKLLRLVRSLEWRPARSAWARYRDTCSLTGPDEAAKRRFVETALGDRRRSLVWDLGCNDGMYARIAAARADTVLAVDADEQVVDRLHQALRAEGETGILPLVVDLLDPSPGRGWRGSERRSFGDRGAPDAVLALALVHHLAISGSVPLHDVVAWLASLHAEVVVELPHREDPMVERLLAAKPAHAHDDYGLGSFEQAIAKRFRVVARQPLPSGNRTLFHLAPAG